MGRTYRTAAALTERDRFWLRVAPSDTCWLWQGRANPGGYGTLSNPSGVGNLMAHRVAWEYVEGPIPADMVVCHICDNPPCVNPAHLFLGTQGDNMRDMVAKGRESKVRASGQGFSNAVGTREMAAEMMALYAAGARQHELVARFGVSKGTVHNILHGNHWSTR